MAVELHGVSSQIGSIMTTRNGVSVRSEEASAWSTTLSMSSGPYSGLAIQELVRGKRKEFMTAPKFSFSEKTEQYVIP